MSKLSIHRGWKAVLNVHERKLPVPAEAVAPVLDSLASKNDRLWPTEKWPPMLLDRGLQIGSQGGHSVVRYKVTSYIPGKRVELEFDPATYLGKIGGRHYFEIVPRPGHTILRHVIDAEIDFSNWLYFKIFTERIHDAVIEDAFDKAEHYAGVPHPHHSRWSLYVRLLRWYRAKKNKKPAR
jgi:hypothetical protein